MFGCLPFLFELQSFESWLEKYDATIEPLRDFFRLHDIDSEWAIAELYKNGYWGRKLMRTVADGHAAGEEDKPYPWETAIETWTDAFLAEQLPHAPMDIIRKWPSLLCKTPDCLPGTVAVLRAAIPNEDDLNETIANFPRVLIQSPVKLQHRILALQMACGMELSRALTRNPQMFYRNLDSIMSNIRHLRDSSWSLEHFANLIDYRPNILTMQPEMVKRNTESSIEAIQMILGDESDAKLVVQAKPHLILLPPAQISERWDYIANAVESIPEWKQEMQDAKEDIIHGTQSRAQKRADEAKEPIKVHPSEGKFGVSHTEDGGKAPLDDAVQNNDSDGWEPGEWGSTTIGQAIWTHPRRHQRLEFLNEVVGSSAGELSFVDALTVHYHKFNHRYPQFDPWVREHYSGFE